MIIRQARMEDVADICAITNAVIRDKVITFTTKERSNADIAAEIALHWRAFQVLEIDGKVAGFATFGPFRSGPGYARTSELTIHLAADARGQGMGRALLQELEQVAKDQGVHVLVAGISGANPAGIAFHAACGYAEVGRMGEVGFKAGQWLDLVLMQKNLADARVGADSAGAPG
jgi:L-amino acid N-acyltransferase